MKSLVVPESVENGRAAFRYSPQFLRQAFAIEHRRFQGKDVHPFEATKVHAVIPGIAGRFAERVDAALPAKIVLGLLCAELVQAERPILRFPMKLRLRHLVGQDHRSPSGTERAVATKPLGDGLPLERETDRAAMTATFVVLLYHFCVSFYMCAGDGLAMLQVGAFSTKAPAL